MTLDKYNTCGYVVAQTGYTVYLHPVVQTFKDSVIQRRLTIKRFDMCVWCNGTNDTSHVLTGTDESVIIKLLARHTNEQRQEIASAFKTAYGEVRRTHCKTSSILVYVNQFTLHKQTVVSLPH